jgi:hypothetical protein
MDGHLTGDLADGEYVYVWGRQRGGTIHATRIYNQDTDSWVTRQRNGCGTAISIGCVGFLVCIAVFIVVAILKWGSIVAFFHGLSHWFYSLLMGLLPVAILGGIVYYLSRNFFGRFRRRR